jgi:hypothetical protein
MSTYPFLIEFDFVAATAYGLTSIDVTFQPFSASVIERKPLPDPISRAFSRPFVGSGMQLASRSVSSLGG